MRYALGFLFLTGLIVVVISPQANTAGAPDLPKTIQVIVTGDAVGNIEPCG